MTLKSGSKIMVNAQHGFTPTRLKRPSRRFRRNPDRLIELPETLRIRGELRLKQEQAEQAQTDFREAIALAQSMGAKAW
jgi:hypothetical protein